MSSIVEPFSTLNQKLTGRLTETETRDLLNAPSLFTSGPTKEAFKKSGIKATDNPANVWYLPAENRRTASDLEPCAIVSSVKESGFNYTFQPASRDERRKSRSKGKRRFVFLCNPVADQPAYFAERRLESPVQANQFYRELVEGAKLISHKPSH